MVTTEGSYYPSLNPEGEPAAPVTRTGASSWRRTVDAGRTLLFRHKYVVLLAVICNVLVLSAYCWSRGGQTTDVRVIVEGNSVQAFADGLLTMDKQLPDAPGRGGIVIGVENTRNIPSLPLPRGVDHVRVTDAAGVVLFEDDFSGDVRNDWEVAAGSVTLADGVAELRDNGSLYLAAEWSDVTVDVYFRNVTGASVTVRAPDARSGISYALRPFRQHDSNLYHLQDGRAIETVAGGQLRAPRSELMKSMVAMTLRPYPLIIPLLAGALLVVFALQFLDRVPWRLSLPDGWAGWLWLVGAIALAGSAFGVSAFLMSVFGDRVPHDGDAVAYVFQAKMFAAGSLSESRPPVPDVFSYGTPSFFPVTHGKWASVYPFGHPLALAVGHLFGLMWIIPPLLSAASVALTFVLGRRLYSAATGFVAALLFAASPFFFMQSSNFLSHSSAVFYFLMALVCLTMRTRRAWVFGALAGIFFGLFFNTQSLSAVAALPAVGAILLVKNVMTERKRDEALRVLGFCVTALALLGAYYVFNYATHGEWTRSGIAAAGFKDDIGFGSEHHSVVGGMQHEQAQLAFFILVFNGWPQTIGLLFLVSFVMLASRNVWDWILFGCAICLVGAYTLFPGNGITIGPRYWYPAVPLLMLLTARAAERSADLIAACAGWLRGRSSKTATTPQWAARAVVYVFIAALVGMSISGWLLSRDVTWRADYVPANAVALQSYYDADDRLVRRIKDAELENALVLVEPCLNWQCYGTVFWLNDPSLDGDTVIARGLPERLPELFRAYPDRQVYVASYPVPGIAPFGFGAQTGHDRDLDEFPPAPRATALRAAQLTPGTVFQATPTGTPPGPESDEQRRRDLTNVAAALVAYRAEHGAFPEARGMQSLCRYQADAGCSLAEQLGGEVPRDPDPGRFYYYLSDTQTFVLFALMDHPQDGTDCPYPLPPDLARAANVYCVRGP